jgi:hypothetical protein
VPAQATRRKAGVAVRSLRGESGGRDAGLAFLAPDITAAILQGHHSPELTAAALPRHSCLALDWTDQRRALGFA